jgi:hypothetical protein
VPLISASPDLNPQERLALYRARGLHHGILLVPFDSLSRLQQEAALLLASEWGRELADLDVARRDLMHTASEERARPLAGLWLMRILESPFHAVDGQYWAEEAERWTTGEGSDPRLAAFDEAWRTEAEGRADIPEPGPGCSCPACKARWGKRRHRHR